MKVNRTQVVDTLDQMCEFMCGTPEEHEYCLRCGRKLKTPDARERGYGLICYKKVIIQKESIKRLF